MNVVLKWALYISGIGIAGYGIYYGVTKYVIPWGQNVLNKYSAKWKAFWTDPLGYIMGKKKLDDVEVPELPNSTSSDARSPRPTMEDVKVQEEAYKLEQKKEADRLKAERAESDRIARQQALAAAKAQADAIAAQAAAAAAPVVQAASQQTAAFVKDPVGTISKGLTDLGKSITATFDSLGSLFKKK